MKKNDIYSELDKLLQVDTTTFKDRVNDFLEADPENSIALGFEIYFNAIYFSDQLNMDVLESREKDEFKLLSLAVLKISSDEYAEAIRLLEEAKSYDSLKRNMWILYELYRAHQALGDDYLAWEYLEKSIDLDPGFIPSRIEKSYHLDQGQNCNEIIELLKPVVSVYQDSEVYGYSHHLLASQRQ